MKWESDKRKMGVGSWQRVVVDGSSSGLEDKGPGSALAGLQVPSREREAGAGGQVQRRCRGRSLWTREADEEEVSKSKCRTGSLLALFSASS